MMVRKVSREVTREKVPEPGLPIGRDAIRGRRFPVELVRGDGQGPTE